MSHRNACSKFWALNLVKQSMINFWRSPERKAGASRALSATCCSFLSSTAAPSNKTKWGRDLHQSFVKANNSPGIFHNSRDGRDQARNIYNNTRDLNLPPVSLSTKETQRVNYVQGLTKPPTWRTQGLCPSKNAILSIAVDHGNSTTHEFNRKSLCLLNYWQSIHFNNIYIINSKKHS